MINEARLIGNVGQAPNIRGGRTGVMASFSVATTEKWQDKDGQWQEKTQWHNISCFGRVAEMVEKYVQKGQQVYVAGSIEYNDGEKDGIKIRYCNIKAQKIKILGSKPKSGGSYKEDAPPSSYDGQGSGGTGEDVPF